MLGTIASFFATHFTRQDGSGESHSEKQLQLASAALLIELCRADQSVDEAETRTLIGILRKRFQLEGADLDELMALAEQEAKDATSLYQFTALMNEHFDYADKVRLIRNMWDVAYADGRIDRYEEYMIRKVADLLYLSHVDFISSKHRARDEAGS